MNQSEIRNIAQEIHEIVCPNIDDHLVCSPNAREHEPVEKAIAEWHLAKLSQLQARNLEMSVDEIKNESVKEMLIDLGFNEHESYPAWAYDLCEQLISYGWDKK